MSVNAVNFLGTGSDDQALALKMYMGSFVEPFRQATMLWDSSLPIIERKNVSNGKSWQFLMDADLPAPEDFTPGVEEMVGQQLEVAENTVTVDKYLVAHQYIRRDEMKIAHFEILPKLARRHARRIGREWDRRLFILNAKNARESALTKNGLTVHNGGNRVTRDDESVSTAYPLSSTGATRFLTDLRQLAENMDTDNIPGDMRWIAMTPYMRHVLQFAGAEVFSKDYFVDNNLNKREIETVAGFKILGFPNTTSNGGTFPDENITTGLSKYQGDFSIGVSNGIPVAQVFCGGEDGQSPLAMVTFESVQHVVEYVPQRLSWFVASYILAGAGQLHPYCSGSIEVIDTD